MALGTSSTTMTARPGGIRALAARGSEADELAGERKTNCGATSRHVMDNLGGRESIFQRA